MFKRRVGGLGIALIIAVILIAGSAGTVSAHASLVRTDPMDGLTLDKAPRQIRLWFNDAVVLDFTRFEMRDGDGQLIPLAPFSIDTESTTTAQVFDKKSVVLLIELPELKPNAYRLQWYTRSADDLHVINGTVTFGIQRAVIGTSTETTPVTQPGEVIMRWLIFLGLGGLVGGYILTALTTKDTWAEATSQLQRRLMQLALYSGLLTFGAGLGLLLFQGLEGAAWWPILTRTEFGLRWGLSQTLITLLLVSLLVQTRALKVFRQSENQSKIAPTLKSFVLHPSAFILPAAITAQSLNGHSGGGNGISPLSIAMDGLHLLGASVWVGGLLVLVVAIGPMLKGGPPQTTLAWNVLRRFGFLAAGSLALLVVTGLYKSGQQVASLDGLLNTIYGQVLLFKVELVLIVGLVGLLNAALLHPRLGDGLRRLLRRPVGWKPLNSRYLGRALVIETIGAGGLLLLAAFLTATQPARGPEFDPPPAVSDTAAVPSMTTNVADLIVNLSVKPNQPGQNFLSVNVFNTRKPYPAPFEGVSVRLRSPENGQVISLTPDILKVEKDKSYNANRYQEGHYQLAGSFINAPGDWDITITVNRTGMEETIANFGWKVLPVQKYVARRPVIISNQPLAPWLNVAALVVALLAIAGWRVLRNGGKVRFPIWRRTGSNIFQSPPPGKD